MRPSRERCASLERCASPEPNPARCGLSFEELCKFHSAYKILYDCNRHIEKVHAQGARCNKLYAELGKYETHVKEEMSEYLKDVWHFVERRMDRRFNESK